MMSRYGAESRRAMSRLGVGMGDMSREPSMEEILSSIRRVIARDDPSLKPGSRALSPMAEALPDNEDEDDILELTEAEAPSDTATDDLQDDIPAMPAPAAPAIADSAIAELVSPLSAAASRSSLDVLAAVLASGKESSEAVAPTGDVSVNALVDAALRPMLKQWLDANLPAIVERLVASEIARITGTRS